MHMYNSRRKPRVEIPAELTAVWSCSDEGCKGWMRDNFAFSVAPVCSLCQSDMIKSEKMLPPVMNTSPTQLKEK